MPLNLSTSDGEFTPYLKYNAKAGRFYVRPQSAAQDVEVEKPRLLFDMEHVKTGWLYYSEGAGPEKVWDPSLSQMAPRPAGPRKFKRGFEVLVFGNDPIHGVGTLGLREFSSTANNVITSFNEMYAEYEAGVKANPGKVPFFGCAAVIPVSGVYGINYEPKFRLLAWVDRAKCPAFDEAMQSVSPPASNGHANGQSNGGGYDDYGADPRDQMPDGPGAQGGSFGGRSGVDLNDEIPF